jgi:hypothetical protein
MLNQFLKGIVSQVQREESKYKKLPRATLFLVTKKSSKCGQQILTSNKKKLSKTLISKMRGKEIKWRTATVNHISLCRKGMISLWI